MLSKSVKSKKKKCVNQTLVAGMALTAAFLLQGNVANAAQDVSIDESNFPDAVFRNYVSDSFDENKDGNLNENEIAKVEKIVIVGEELEWEGREPYDHSKYTSAGLKSVKGIEYFTNLSSLFVSCNDISELDISKNTALKALYCGNNHLKTLDISNNPELENLDCVYNELQYVDIKNCPKLVLVATQGGTGLPGGTGPFPGKTYTNIYYKDEEHNTTYTLKWDDSTQMVWTPDAEIDSLFPDEGFRKYIREHIDTNGDGMLSTSERYAVQTIDCSGSADSKGVIKSLKGLDCFPVLEVLKCSHNEISNLDITKNGDLKVLDCSSNPLEELTIFKEGDGSAHSLKELYCYDCKLSTLNVEGHDLEEKLKSATRTVDQDVITYTYGDYIVKLDQDVKIVPEIIHVSDPTAFNIVPETIVIAVDDEQNVEVKLEPEDADPLVYWDSTDNGIAYVSDGVLYAREMGKVTITASTKNSLVDTCVVAVVLDSEESNPFADVTSKEGWEYPFVKKIFDLKVMNGKGELVSGRTLFAPNDTLTRAEFAQVIYNMEKTPEVKYQNVFSDVPEGKWYTDAIIWAYENKIVAGKGDFFDIDAPATREQVAVMLSNYAKFKGYDVAPVEGKGKNIEEFADKESISDWAVDGLKWALSNEIMVGKVENLDPASDSKRSECAAMITHYLENVQK